MGRELPVLPKPAESETLPDLYHGWLTALLNGRIPRESNATCTDCAMCSATAQQIGVTFDPSEKCCTYLPDLPNYLVGQILRDRTIPGAVRASILERVSDGSACTALGIAMTPSYRIMYRAASSVAFGRSSALRCPHKTESGCGIWRHRNSVCATYFCKHVRGQRGFAFWHAVRHLLHAVEAELSMAAAARVTDDTAVLRDLLEGFEAPPERQLGMELTASSTRPTRVTPWGRWATRQDEFFMQCAEWVETLDWPQVIANTGPRVRMAAAVVTDAYQSLLSSTLPGSLVLGEFKVVGGTEGLLFITTYSRTDPLVVGAALLTGLSAFNGRRSVTEAQRVFATECGEELDLGELSRLVDFGLLRASSEGTMRHQDAVREASR